MRQTIFISLLFFSSTAVLLLGASCLPPAGLSPPACDRDADCAFGMFCNESGFCLPIGDGDGDGDGDGTDSGTLDAGLSLDAGLPDAGLAVDAGILDAGLNLDAGNLDAGLDLDAGSIDAGSNLDAGSIDAGSNLDAGSIDAGLKLDAGTIDAGTLDAGSGGDGGPLADAGPCGPGVVVGWWDSCWASRATFNIDNAPSEDLDDFPVLIGLSSEFSINDEDLNSLRFFYEDELLDHEVESWTGASRRFIWIRLPTLRSSGGTITMYYGNDAAVNIEDGLEVFGPRFSHALHFASNVDNSANNSDAPVSSGGMTRSGQVSNAWQLSSSLPPIDLAEREGTNDAYISFWVYVDQNPLVASPGAMLFYANGANVGVTQDGFDNYEMHLSRKSDGSLRMVINDSANDFSVESAQGVVTLQSWHHIGMTWNAQVGGIPSGGRGKVWVNGIEVINESYVANDNYDFDTMLFGSAVDDPAVTRVLVGAVDEFRMAANALPDAWPLAEYQSMTNQLLSLPVEEP